MTCSSHPARTEPGGVTSLKLDKASVPGPLLEMMPGASRRERGNSRERCDQGDLQQAHGAKTTFHRNRLHLHWGRAPQGFMFLYCWPALAYRRRTSQALGARRWRGVMHVSWGMLLASGDQLPCQQVDSGKSDRHVCNQQELCHPGLPQSTVH